MAAACTGVIVSKLSVSCNTCSVDSLNGGLNFSHTPAVAMWFTWYARRTRERANHDTRAEEGGTRQVDDFTSYSVIKQLGAHTKPLLLYIDLPLVVARLLGRLFVWLVLRSLGHSVDARVIVSESAYV